MPILETDIKLLESQRMTDTSDGGGRMTSNEVPDGVTGNIFPKVSRVDSVYGRVNLRKVYAAVKTATLDTYAGAHCIITDPPDNDKIGCVLFSTGSSFDVRSAAQDRIESYVVAGPLSRMRLYGTQLIGQKAVSCYQRTDEPLPDVGDVIVLSVEASGYTPAQQYCRITDVTHEVRTFTDSSGDYQRRVLTLKIGAALSQTFTGAEPTRYNDPSPTKVRLTQVADASKYYGIQPLAEAADVGALDLRLASVYAPLVPSTQRETALSLAQVSDSVQMREAGAVRGPVYYGSGLDVLAVGTVIIYLGGPIAPNSLDFRIQFGSTWGVSDYYGIKEVDGILITTQSDGRAENYLTPISLDHSVGRLEFVTPSQFAPWSVYAMMVPGAQVSAAAHNYAIPITLATRGTVYAETLLPIPAPGTTIVDFRALGKWYRLRDNGAGVLVANDPSEGTGSIDYTTGALVVTLGALPDVDSSLLMAWGSPVHYAIRAGATSAADTALGHTYTVPGVPILPGSVTISYPVGGISRNATDASADGNVSGTGVTGSINYATGEVRLRFTAPPDLAATISTNYTKRDGTGLIATGTTATISGGQFTVPGSAPFENSGRMTFQAAGPAGTITAAAYITSGGQVRVRAGRTSDSPIGSIVWSDQAVGTFNAATGVVSITGDVSASKNEWVRGEPSGGIAPQTWQTTIYAIPITGVSDIVIERDDAAFDPLAELEEHAISGLTLALCPGVADSVVPGSLLFDLTGKTYIDRSGTLYTDVDPRTGSGTPAGTVDYQACTVTLTEWENNTALALNVHACLTQRGNWSATGAAFRTAGSPLRPASFYAQVTAIDGTLITGTADQNGNVTGTYMRGSVQQTMGVAALEFGEYIGGVWTPIEVQPSTLRYNGVVMTSLPLDAALLGLDPTRLPIDGHVPIYRPGDVVVIHHTATDTLPAPLAASTLYSLSRGALARAWVEDSDGQTIPADQYILDLSTGTLTTSAALDLSGYTQPIRVRHRIEDMALLTDVQINGQISLSAPTNHAYPLGSYVSCALLCGDMGARVTSLFDQATWSGVWSDERIGADATATYNDLDYPVEVRNDGAVTERWRINFTSATAFQVIGENLGVIATGDTSTDLSPVNTLTGQPYFTLRAAGWGLGWAAGNQLRFNTIGANAPIWIARTILAGATLDGDSFDVEMRGDTD